MKGYKEPCGCRSIDSEWIKLCPAHEAEWQEIHARWKADHEAQKQTQPVKRDSNVRRKSNSST